MSEVWKTVIGYEEYEISSHGRVRRNNIIKKQRVVNKHYVINLCKDGIKSTHKVHRLVAKAFIPNPENKSTVDHIDNTKPLDNHLENLRWATHKEQANNRGTFPLAGTNTGEPYITFNKNYIVAIRQKGRKTFPTLEEAIVYRDSLLQS